MERQKGVKKINLFSGEGVWLLSQDAQVWGSSESEPCILHEETERRSTSIPISSLVQCTSCHTTFADREEQVEHYRLDWHRFNLKRRLKDLPPVSQDVFERESVGDLSSISGTESSDESDIEEENVFDEKEDKRYIQHQRGSPLVLFTTSDGVHHALYKTLFTRDKVVSNEIVISALRNLCKHQIWIVLMKSGGHFAAAVFDGSAVLAHKTFHRYTVRAKRGTVQSSHDSQSGGSIAKSAGASIRRHNEAALAQEINDLLLSWKQHIDAASGIFIRAPKQNRKSLFSAKDCPIKYEDPRIRDIPFNTRRPTFGEIKSVHMKLATIYSGVTPQTDTKTSKEVLVPTIVETHSCTTCSDKILPLTVDTKNLTPEPHSHTENSTSHTDDEDSSATPKTTPKRRRRRKKKENQQVEETVDPLTRQLHQLCNQDDVDGLEQLLLQELVGKETAELDINAAVDGRTALHLAAAQGHVDVVKILLLHGANPALKNSKGQVPYLAAKDKPTRDSFRRFMSGHPDKYDYTAAQIPSPLTEEQAAAQREKKNEKKKAQKKAQKERKQKEKLEKELDTAEKNRDKTVESLSEREKRAMAAEKRLVTQLPSSAAKFGTCAYCGSSLCGVVPFERLEYKYCKIECVREHRKQLART